MKICEYIPTASFFVGGGEIYPLMQASAMANRGHEVVLVTLKTNSESEYFKKYREQNTKIRYEYVVSPIEEFNSFASRELNHVATHELYYSVSRTMSSLCNSENFDAVIVHYGPGMISIPGSTKAVLLLHGTPFEVQPVNQAAIAVADLIFADSKSIIEGWSDLYGLDKNTLLLPNAVDTLKYFPQPHEKDIDVLYVGRLIEIKGVQHLIKAVSILNESGFDIKLVVAGKGPYENELKDLVSHLGIENSVQFIGYVEESDKNTLYNRAKICVFPSYAKEGVLTTLLEAASCKNAVITSNCCGMVDFVKDNKNGLLFEPKNEIDLSQKIRLLLSDTELRNRLADQAHVDINIDWSWEKHAEKFEQLLLK